MNTVIAWAIARFILPLWQQPLSHYQMSGMYEMAEVSICHCSMRNKVQVSLWCCAWSGSRHIHSSPPRSRQVEEVVEGSSFLSARLFIVLFGALIKDILSTIAPGVETGSKFSDVYQTMPPIHLPVTGGSKQWTIAFSGRKIILHILLKYRFTGFLITKTVFPMHCHSLIYVALCGCFSVLQGTVIF